MDGGFESLKPNRKKRFLNSFIDQNDVFGSSDDDEKIEEEEYSVIIDINNNNSDSAKNSIEASQVDNTNLVLDSTTDKDELTAGITRPGHNFGEMKLTMFRYDVIDSGSEKYDSNYSVKLVLETPPGQLKPSSEVVRVFDYGEVSSDNSAPAEILGPRKTEHVIDTQTFFETTNRNRNEFSNKNYVIEGLAPGFALIRAYLEKTLPDGTTEISQQMDDMVRVTVNVDRTEQPVEKIASNVDAQALRGAYPHYLGLRKTGISTSGVRALKGRLIAHLPSATFTNANPKTHLTWMRNNTLRRNATGDSKDSGASFWIGIKDVNGSEFTWVQCGLRWRQRTNDLVGTQPFAYIESGTSLTGYSPVFERANAAPENGVGAGGGALKKNISALQGWDTTP